jgi:TolB-like protein/DNA-binding winged helix-turn-helix (wHTH) protein
MNLISPRTALFGPYALDLRSGELRKYGTKLKMGEQAFQILCMLLENPGEMVTREQLRTKLWAEDTFVDFDHGLNSAVQRLRDCLSDSASKPLWVETVPRRGYRFIGRVEWGDEVASYESPSKSTVAVEDEDSTPGPAPVFPAVQNAPRRTWTVPQRIVLCAGAVLVLIVVALPIVRRIHGAPLEKPAPIRSLAVLPLENLSGDPAQEYFADGMTDEVITMLAKNPALHVTSRTSVMQYKKVHRPLREIAKELGVEGILEGSVGRSGNRVHVTAQLIRADSDTHLWADSFDRDLSDVGSLQTELAQAIAKQVGATASVSGKPEKKIKPEAHDVYLLGRYYWFAGDYGKSREYFQKAIDLDPTYAAAWSGLADSYSASVAEGSVRPDVVMPQAEADARKALELDDLDDEAHRSMAAIQFFYRWDWDAADKESARAVELNPALGENHHFRAYVLSALNRTDESLQEDRKAIELDPFVRPWEMGYALIRARQFDAAVNELRMRSEAQQNQLWLHGVLSEAYLYKGMEREAEQESEQEMRLNNAKQLADEQHQIFSRGGFQAVLEWKLKRWNRSAAKHYISPIDFAQLYARLKRKEDTLRYLDLAYKEHAPFMAHIQCISDFDFLHSEPRYRAIVKGIGLPPAY